MIRATHGKFFLENVSGLGRLSRAVSNLGVSCHLFDNKLGPPGDVLLPKVEKRIMRLIADPNCIGVWMAMPCGTLSRAEEAMSEAGPRFCAERMPVLRWVRPHSSPDGYPSNKNT